MIDPVKIGDCSLYFGDCREIMPKLMPVDVLVTDPPYELTSGGNAPNDLRMRGCFSTSDYSNSGKLFEHMIDWSDWIPLLPAVMAERSHGYVMCNNRHVAKCQNEIERAGFHFHNLLVWDKRTATPNRWYMKNCEYVFFFSQGKAFQINDCSAKQLIHIPQRDQTDHPTEKPVMLMEHYIRQSTKPGQVVLDPFMGTGTTGIAAANLGRKFIGIEKDPEYFEMARDRIARAAKAPVQEVLV